MRRVLLAGCVMTMFAGCTWVHMAPGASAVRVMNAGTPPAGCAHRGEIAVSVKDSIAFYDRNDLRVREELETLARNEAPGIQADSIQPLGPPSDGEQRFAAYHCGASPAVPGPASSNAGPASPQSGVQTYPIQG